MSPPARPTGNDGRTESDGTPVRGPAVAAARRRPRSLRWRLLIATLAAAALALLLAGWLLAGLFREAVTRQFASLLTAQLDQVVTRLEVGPEGAPVLDAAQLSDPRWLRPYSGLYWQVEVHPAAGRPRPALRSRSLWDTELAAPPDEPADAQVHVHEVAGPGGARLLLVERLVRLDGAAHGPWRVQVAADLRDNDAAVQRFNTGLGASLAVLLLVLVAAAGAQVHVGLAPLRALQRAVAAVRSGRAARLEGGFPAEVQPLVDDFNGVLDRNLAVVDRARTQAGNLAHAIKTPLSALLQAAEAARQRPAELAQLPARVDEQVALARRHVDWHLARARAAAAHGMPGVHTDVALVVEGLRRVMSRVHAARGLRLQVGPLPPGLRFAGEAQDMHEMLGNLLDNACQWARAEVRVSVALDRDAATPRFTLVVEDDGPGIAEADRDAALARGGRLDESRPGSGLGLAIVQELATLYGGTLTLDRATPPLGGLRAQIRLPALPPAPPA
ncbi:sensor histidine kinase [Ideonella sp.]|uniref:sensor histidine kinase n=1 Tax=Ideonella sp. TaxID=1929293 RepID=UPI0035B0F28A